MSDYTREKAEVAQQDYLRQLDVDELTATENARDIALRWGLERERELLARIAVLEKSVERLTRESVEIAEYGLGRDGCPFCARISEHADDCVAKALGARDYADLPPERNHFGDHRGFPDTWSPHCAECVAGGQIPTTGSQLGSG